MESSIVGRSHCRRDYTWTRLTARVVMVCHEVQHNKTYLQTTNELNPTLVPIVFPYPAVGAKVDPDHFLNVNPFHVKSLERDKIIIPYRDHESSTVSCCQWSSQGVIPWQCYFTYECSWPQTWESEFTYGWSRSKSKSALYPMIRYFFVRCGREHLFTGSFLLCYLNSRWWAASCSWLYDVFLRD